jgi:hypothetical protein
MTSDPPEPDEQLDISYHAVSGEQVHTQATVSGIADHLPVSLLARSIELADGTPARQLLVDEAQLPAGYQCLDNEILAGTWLYQLTKSRRYPDQVSRLIGYAADGAEPFALVREYDGEPAAAAARHLTPEEQRLFQVSLLTGLRWLAEAGIAHCAIGADTVRWDGDRVLITDFSQATVFGVSRDAPGRQIRQGYGLRTGPVTDRDDVWAAILLCYYISEGQDFSGPDQLANWSAGGDLAAELMAGPEGCQSAHEILTTRLGAADPVPRRTGPDPALARGIEEFFRVRKAKHPMAPSAVPWAPQPRAAAPDPPVPDHPFPNPPLQGTPPDDEHAAAAEEAGPGRKERRWARRRR